MVLDPSQLLPTFLNLLHLSDPRHWLSSLLPTILARALYLPGTRSDSSAPAAIIASAQRKSIAFNLDTPTILDFPNHRGVSTDKGGFLSDSPKDDHESTVLSRGEMTQLQGSDGEDESGRSNRERMDSLASTSSQNTVHADPNRVPTQSNTLTQAQAQAYAQYGGRPHLVAASGSDFSSLTPEQIAQLNANMLEDMNEADARPLVSIIQPMETLMGEYASNPGFLRKMEWLKKQGWLGVRRTKGDGDCFYRSFAFAWVERILRAKDRQLAVAAAISTLHTTFLGLSEVGFDPLLLQDFYDILRSLVEQVINPEEGGKTLNASLLLEAFTDPAVSNSIVSYVRLLASAELRSHADEYAAFVVHPETQESMPIKDFCEQFVDGLGKEADHVQMQALAKAMGVNLSVAYLDGHEGKGDAVDFVKFEMGGGSEVNGIEDVVLLYRPGHYDILEHRGHEHRQSTASALVTPSVME